MFVLFYLLNFVFSATVLCSGNTRGWKLKLFALIWTVLNGMLLLQSVMHSMHATTLWRPGF
jgi:hypothetical protein